MPTFSLLVSSAIAIAPLLSYVYAIVANSTIVGSHQPLRLPPSLLAHKECRVVTTPTNRSCLGSTTTSTLPLPSRPCCEVCHRCCLDCVANASLCCHYVAAPTPASLLGSLPLHQCCFVVAAATAPLLPLRSLHYFHRSL
ncbi:hypothetical protein DEO72_LG8g1883 [Vigna unguiculata]|uniref:Uncharacterized protein n=1 Tax=Vigna unguiculata TaxID=3917 RepID=A0A4D6MSV3_VIGUN|nr:hypothetical protein DEO72_LG8g1883 [Vigna unguiculata]